MDSESSRPPVQIWKYDVFLSFMAEDTGKTFTDHLLAALRRKGIFTIMHDQEKETIKAIEESQISIIVFSKKYAASLQCLEDLEKVMECRRPPIAQTVLPVFYHVYPTDVRYQTGTYKNAFDEHEKSFSDNKDKIQRWRDNLTEVANMTGWTLQYQLEAEVIDNIVKKTINILSHKCLSVANDFVGIQSQIKEVEELLDLQSDAVRVVGLYGMSGIGKTALASVVYHKTFDQFEHCCFLDNVSEFSKSDGLTAVQEQLLRATLKWKEVEICNVYEGSVWIRRTLENNKTLLVLDNVDELEQLQFLAGHHNWFGEGSKIIITTRDKHILDKFEVDETYKMKFLKGEEARQLFCRGAFRCDSPMEGYKELTDNILEFAKCLPLAVKSLGLVLLDRDESEWKIVLAKLQSIPEHHIMRVLEQRFDGFPDDIEKGIFLDIARFLVGEKIGYLKEIPSQHQYYPMFGNKILIDKSLMTTLNPGRNFREEANEEQGQRSRSLLL